MWYKGVISSPVLLIPVLIITTKGTHTPKNDTNPNPDVIVKYAQHADAYQDYKVVPVSDKTTEAVVVKLTSPISKMSTVREKDYSSDYLSDTDNADEGPPNPEDDIVFVPNERELVRNEEYLMKENLNLNDILDNRKTINDVMSGRGVKPTTDEPHGDIIFVQGKNNENIEEPTTEKSRRYYSDDKLTKPSSKKLICSNLLCSNNLKSVCGSKLENGRWRFRLFLNECYFRKVNCNFNVAENRYNEVPLSNCKAVGMHSMKPFSFKPQNNLESKPVHANNTKRSTKSSRRSMTLGIDGQFCSHPCPASCSDQYSPECAVSASGRHRVFINHCALDHNSCSFGVVWHKRPLSECVGGKKADMQHNAGFIGWMQRVGIVDKRGRLVLS